MSSDRPLAFISLLAKTSAPTSQQDKLAGYHQSSSSGCTQLNGLASPVLSDHAVTSPSFVVPESGSSHGHHVA
ncbi:hypothetical protein VTO73DRAFT_15098 [Trametes versicolor]